MQRILLCLILEHGRPMTFADIRAAVGPTHLSSLFERSLLYSSLDRSLRRALHGMLGSWLIALGDGGRADPYRYFFNPTMIERDKALHQALQAALDADPGAEEAERREVAKLRKGFAAAADLAKMSSGTADAEGPKA
jgi:hypothetical protein